MVTVGNSYRFKTQDTAYADLSGKLVFVVRELLGTEADTAEVGRMFEIHFETGFRLEAFEDELKEEANG